MKSLSDIDYDKELVKYYDTGEDEIPNNYEEDEEVKD